MPEDTTYEGWKNKATWNVFLYLANEADLYAAIMQHRPRIKARRHPYRAAIYILGLQSSKTPDGYYYISNRLDYGELNSAVLEMLD